VSKLYSAEDNSKLFFSLPQEIITAASLVTGTGKYDKDIAKDTPENHDKLDKYLRTAILEIDVYAKPPSPRARSGSTLSSG